MQLAVPKMDLDIAEPQFHGLIANSVRQSLPNGGRDLLIVPGHVLVRPLLCLRTLAFTRWGLRAQAQPPAAHE
jgi:hypothetical protein